MTVVVELIQDRQLSRYTSRYIQVPIPTGAIPTSAIPTGTTTLTLTHKRSTRRIGENSLSNETTVRIIGQLLLLLDQKWSSLIRT